MGASLALSRLSCAGLASVGRQSKDRGSAGLRPVARSAFTTVARVTASSTPAPVRTTWSGPRRPSLHSREAPVCASDGLTTVAGGLSNTERVLISWRAAACWRAAVKRAAPGPTCRPYARVDGHSGRPGGSSELRCKQNRPGMVRFATSGLAMRPSALAPTATKYVCEEQTPELRSPAHR